MPLLIMENTLSVSKLLNIFTTDSANLSIKYASFSITKVIPGAIVLTKSFNLPNKPPTKPPTFPKIPPILESPLVKFGRCLLRNSFIVFPTLVTFSPNLENASLALSV